MTADQLHKAALNYHGKYSRELAGDMDAQREVCALRRAGALATYTQERGPTDILILTAVSSQPNGWVPTMNWWA